jgi:uncharacterized protein
VYSIDHRPVFRLLLLSLLLLATGCSKAPDQAVEQPAGKPALWKVTGKKGVAWLFGSVHLLPPDTGWQTPAIDDAVRGSDVLVLETSGLDDPQAMGQTFAQLGMSGGLPTIASRVDPALRPIIDKLDEAIPGPRKVLDHMESWAAALTLAAAINDDLDLSADRGVEHVLTLRFRADEKPVQGLETVSQQFGFFDQLSEQDQRRMLDSILRGARESRGEYQQMLKAWLRGDADAVLQDQQGGVLASPAIREALLDGRNRNWAKQIAAMVDQGSKSFVAVGAGHMAGKNGVPALLMAAGYRVERIQ